MQDRITHPLENDTLEAAHFQALRNPNGKAEYRRAVERLTGGLPTWAYRKAKGRPRKEAKQ